MVSVATAARNALFVYAKYLDRSRFDVRVHGLGERAGDNVQIYQDVSLPFSESDDLTEVLATFRPDIVHIHRGGWENPEHIEAIKAAGVKTLIETNVFGRPNPHPSVQLIDCHIFVSYFCMRRYHEWVGHPLVSDRYATLYNPLDPKDFEGRSAQRTCEMVVGRYSRADDKNGTPGATRCIQPWLERFPLRSTTSQVRHQRSANSWLNMDWKTEFTTSHSPMTVRL